MTALCRRASALVALSVLAFACNRKDAEKCSEALATTRQALEARDMNSAIQWRNYAYKQCEDVTQPEALDKEIAAKQQAIAAEAAEKKKKEALHQQVVGLLRQWAAQFRQHPEQSAPNIVCEHEDDAKLKASKERFCEGKRAVTGTEGLSMVVRYWEKTPADAALFHVKVQLPATCAALGGHRVIKESSLASSDGRAIKRTHCELTEGALSGLQAQATEAANSELRIFTPKYPDQDPVLKFQLQ